MPGPIGLTTSEGELLAAARNGDEAAFERLIAPHRTGLQAHCYRMMASVHDAEDAMQEAMLRAWRAIGRFEGRSSLKSWLYTIATNTCLTALERRPKRILPLDHMGPSDPQDGPGIPLVESVWVEPYPDAGLGLEDGYAAPDARYEVRESVELAFIAAVQHLPATQRAVLLLRDVLGYSAREVAEALETTVPSANSALQRARKTLEDKLPQRTQQATLRQLGDEKVGQIVRGYMDAMQRHDVDAVVSMLAEEASWSMPPLATWYHGPELPNFLRVGPLSGDWQWKHRSTWSNGQPAIGAYTWDDKAGAYLPFALDVLTLDGDQITAITSFIVRTIDVPDPEKDFVRYPDHGFAAGQVERVFGLAGLPDRLD